MNKNSLSDLSRGTSPFNVARHITIVRGGIDIFFADCNKIPGESAWPSPSRAKKILLLWPSTTNPCEKIASAPKIQVSEIPLVTINSCRSEVVPNRIGSLTFPKVSSFLLCTSYSSTSNSEQIFSFRIGNFLKRLS